MAKRECAPDAAAAAAMDASETGAAVAAAAGAPDASLSPSVRLRLPRAGLPCERDKDSFCAA